MISKKNRFTKKLFERVFPRSQRIRKKNFEFLISDARNGEHWSVVVGKKIIKYAVRRNRIRRQLYEIIRHHFLGKFSQKNVICLYKGSEKLENRKEFEAAIEEILKKNKK